MLQELMVAIIIVALTLLLVNPGGLGMPDMLVMVLLSLLAVAFAIFAVFVWRERVQDEREALHRMIAARFAFLASAGALIIGIAVQSFRHTLDPWLPFALVIMVIAKIIGLAYGRRNH